MIGDTMYVHTPFPNIVYALDLANEGKIIWNTGDDPFMGRGGMIHVDGKLLIQDGETGYLRVVEPKVEGYKELAVADIFGKKAEVDEQIAAQEYTLSLLSVFLILMLIFQ